MRKAVYILKGKSIFCLVFFLFFSACRFDAKNAVFNQVENSGKSENLYYLNAKNISFTQPIEPDVSEPQNYKFLQVEVVKVINPNKHPVIFELFYEDVTGEKILLGTFSLFPSDNPDNFIVRTNSKMKSDGKLILSLNMPENFKADDKLQIAVKKIKFRKD